MDAIELDYKPESLRHVDRILDGFREPGSNAVAESIFVFGCYLGEVMVRNAGYEWVDTPPDLAKQLGMLTVYRASTRAHASPIWKAFKRVDNGESDSVTYFYHVFTTIDPPS
ncbi:hypothetical protein [Mycobacterium camsae]|uniref:hypothetical protein n=1 Tax=Mycobacterium gordonae TaxID=1778 RepID=UPI001F121EA0|nr:hypothetical protein [Mycobacterium gordonae]